MAIERPPRGVGESPPARKRRPRRVQRQFTHRGISEHEEAANSNEEQ